jgi:C-terminal processing protease CtpA/Prc
MQFSVSLAEEMSLSLSMQRSSLREEWGITLQYTILDDKLLLCVKQVTADSPSSRLLQVGDIINTINDWEIEKTRHPEVAANLFRAAGNFVSLDIDR